MADNLVSPDQQPVKPSPDRCQEELNRLYYLYRLANLNARYYGRRAASYEMWLRYALVLVAVLSALALALVLGLEPTNQGGRNAAAIGSGFATVLMAVIPSLGWIEKIRELRNLHFGYSQLFTQVESLITEIRRADHLTPEHIGMSRVIHDIYLRLHSMDELEPVQKIVDEEDAKVREAFPDDYLWKRF